MAVPCGDWNTDTHTQTHTYKAPTPPASPLATAAVLWEAAIPLADQILSVAFPLINGHLLPPFSLHGYTLSLCSSNHLIVTTFNPTELACLWCRRLLPAYTCLPHTSWGRHKGTQTNKPSRQRSYGRQTRHFCLRRVAVVIPGKHQIGFAHFQKQKPGEARKKGNLD